MPKWLIAFCSKHLIIFLFSTLITIVNFGCIPPTMKMYQGPMLDNSNHCTLFAGGNDLGIVQVDGVSVYPRYGWGGGVTNNSITVLKGKHSIRIFLSGHTKKIEADIDFSTEIGHSYIIKKYFVLNAPVEIWIEDQTTNKTVSKIILPIILGKPN